MPEILPPEQSGQNVPVLPRESKISQLRLWYSNLPKSQRIALSVVGLGGLFAAGEFFFSQFTQARPPMGLAYSRMMLVGLGFVVFPVLWLVSARIFKGRLLALIVSVLLSAVAMIALDWFAPKPQSAKGSRNEQGGVAASQPTATTITPSLPFATAQPNTNPKEVEEAARSGAREGVAAALSTPNKSKPEPEPIIDVEYKIMPSDPNFVPGTVIAGVPIRSPVIDARLYLTIAESPVKNLDFVVHLIHQKNQLTAISGAGQQTPFKCQLVPVKDINDNHLPNAATVIGPDGKSHTVTEGSTSQFVTLEVKSDTWRVHCDDLFKGAQIELAVLTDKPYRTKMPEGFMISGDYTYGDSLSTHFWNVTKFDETGRSYEPSQEEFQQLLLAAYYKNTLPGDVAVPSSKNVRPILGTVGRF